MTIGENSLTRRHRIARKRKSGRSFGNESRSGWNISPIYDVSRGKSVTKVGRVFATNGGITSKASWVDRNVKIKINESAR